MKKFLLRSIMFLVVAILTSIAVFLWLHKTTVLPAITEEMKTFDGLTPSSTEVSTQVKEAVVPENFKVPEGGIKLSTLTLGESQKKALQTAGINIETFVITEAMISCGVGKLGEVRAGEIFGGATPTLIETGKLLPCLSS